MYEIYNETNGGDGKRSYKKEDLAHLNYYLLINYSTN